MIYLDPQMDIAFKKLFGDSNHKNILISFLNAILEKKETDAIVDVFFNNPQNSPETIEGKMSIVDVRCQDIKGNHYIVEMQVDAQKDYAIRAQYYSSLALSRQLAKGGKYKRLEPVIFIGVLNFNLVQGQEYLNHYFITNSKTSNNQEFRHLEFHLLELKKFKKEITENSSLVDKWIYFLKTAKDIENIPDSLKDPALQEAFGVLERGAWTMQELDQYERLLDAMRSHESILETAIENAVEKAIEDGLAQGQDKKAKEIAKQLLAVLETKAIAKVTGLSIAEIEELKK